MKPRKDDIFDQVRQKLDRQSKRFGVWKKQEFGSVKVTRRFAFSEDAFSSAWQHSKRTNSPYIIEDNITKEQWEVSVKLINDEEKFASKVIEDFVNKETVKKIDTTPALVD